MHRTSIKTHAYCRNNQAPIDAILALVREHDLAPEAITRIRVGVLEARWAIVAEPAGIGCYVGGDPENPLSHAEIEAKLCALTRGVLTGDGQQRVIDAVASLGEELRPAALAMLLGSSEILAAGVADLE